MPKTILTVDDSKTMRDMLKLALNGAGHQVIQADDGVEGVEALARSGGVDVIITDINMPRLDGYGFIAKVRQDPANRATVVALLAEARARGTAIIAICHEEATRAALATRFYSVPLREQAA